ncbi:MAG: hypothetical protein AAFX55_17735 [Bacteroidota bacterium]
MKTTRYNFAILVMLLSLMIKAYAQKPEIQVNFEITENTSIYIAFEDTLEDLKSKARDTLIKGLNEYIGFLNFTSEDVPNNLKFTLNNKIDSSVSEFIPQEYWFFLELNDAASGNTYAHQCKFLGISEIDGILSSPEALLNKLGQVWRAYLKVSYNKELVNVLFHKVAINLPNDIPIIDNLGDKEAVLPFQKEKLKMDPGFSVFKVVIEGELSTGATRRTTNNDASFSRFIDENMPVPDSLIGCILIELKNLPQMTPLGGMVFITTYERKSYPIIDGEASEFED